LREYCVVRCFSSGGGKREGTHIQEAISHKSNAMAKFTMAWFTNKIFFKILKAAISLYWQPISFSFSQLFSSLFSLQPFLSPPLTNFVYCTIFYSEYNRISRYIIK